MNNLSSQARSIVFLPGGVMPAAPQWTPVVQQLDAGVRPFFKDLEVYASPEPPADYTLELEIEGLAQFAKSNELDAFDLVAYSGGAAIALAFVALYPDRVKSLALTEPAVIPSQQWLREESAKQERLQQIMQLPEDRRMGEFVRAHLRPGVTPPPPPPGPPPPWMAKRPAGLKAMARAFDLYDLDLQSLKRFNNPVYLAIGGLSDEIEERKAAKLAALFPDFTCEVYAERHHFDPPQRAEPQRFARALVELWKRAPR